MKFVNFSRKWAVLFPWNMLHFIAVRSITVKNGVSPGQQIDLPERRDQNSAAVFP
jgi:hypothetical protein